MKNQVEQVSFPNLKQSDGWRLAKEEEHYTVYLDGERFLTGTSKKVQELNRRAGEGKHPMLQRAFTALREQQGMSLEEAAEKMYVSVPESESSGKRSVATAAGILAAFLQCLWSFSRCITGREGYKTGISRSVKRRNQ